MPRLQPVRHISSESSQHIVMYEITRPTVDGIEFLDVVVTVLPS